MEEATVIEKIKDITVKSLEDSKANEIVCLNLESKTDLCKYFIICSGTSDTHVRAIFDRLLREVKKNKIKTHGNEGSDTGNWVVIDLGMVIVHIFKEEVRRYYNLENMWDE